LLFVVLMSGDARAGQQDHEINKNWESEAHFNKALHPAHFS
jgi:hypothetical protein